MLRFNESGTVDVNLPSRRIGVFNGELAAAANLKAIVKYGSRIESIVAKTGAGIINFEELHRRSRAVFDGGIDVVGMAAGEKRTRDHGGDEQQSALFPMGHYSASLVCDEESEGEFWWPNAFSSRSMRLSNSGRRWKMVTARSQTRLSKPGEPEIILPGGTSCETADCAVRITPSPTVQ